MGLFPIAVRVFHKKPRIIRLSHYTSIKGWDKTNLLLRKSVKENLDLDCDQINIEVYEKLDAAKKIINEIGDSINKIDVDTLVVEIKDKWEGKDKFNLKKKHEKCITLSEFGKVLIDRKNKAKKPTTRKWYQDAIDVLSKMEITEKT